MFSVVEKELKEETTAELVSRLNVRLNKLLQLKQEYSSLRELVLGLWQSSQEADKQSKMKSFLDKSNLVVMESDDIEMDLSAKIQSLQSQVQVNQSTRMTKLPQITLRSFDTEDPFLVVCRVGVAV